MNSAPFFKLGEFTCKWHIPIIIFWILLILGCLPFIPDIITPFKTTGFIDDTSTSAKADSYLDQKLGYGDQSILIIYHSKRLKADDPLFIKKIKNSLSNLDDFPIKNEVIYPDTNKKQISKDKHTAYVVILFKTIESLSQDNINLFKKLIKKPSNLTMKFGGEPIFIDELNKQTQKDLLKADMVAAPVSLFILIFIFKSVVAALIPLVIGGGCAIMILTSLYFLGHGLTLSIFTINIALLLGLCLTLDYALFIISRFRDELLESKSITKAIADTMHTAGKAVFFSGLAVFISLSVLLFFPINIIFSLGVGGLVAVTMAVLVSLVVLPAILYILKDKINRLPVVLYKRKNKNGPSAWRWLAQKVIKHPLIYFLSILIVLLLLGYPFLNVKFGISDTHILPVHSESRNFLDNYKNKFNEQELTPIVLILSSKTNILSQKSLSKLYDFAKKLKSNPLITRVDSIVTRDNMTKQQYYMIYKSGLDNKNKAIKQSLKTTTGKYFTTFSIVSKYPTNSFKTQDLISQLEKMKPGKGLSMQITGVPVHNNQVLDRLASLFPYALIWIIGLTYLILLILLKSLFLPLKAIVMNMLSLCASYGILVYVFQEGHFHNLLNFEPQSIMDTSLLVIIFCALFGFSMDYEVFLLTRIKEYYDKTKNNNESIIFGIDKSSRIITSAALIVIFLCGSFMVADVLMVKEFGLGIAVAIFVDAFLVRSILVPSTMALVKSWNWYLPKWLKKILRSP
jgi:RND superfamily putative drug exporter